MPHGMNALICWGKERATNAEEKEDMFREGEPIHVRGRKANK